MSTKQITVLDKDLPVDPPSPDLPPAITNARLSEREILQSMKNPLAIVTPAQARDEAVANALRAAYERASTLVFTDKESAALCAEFVDEDFRTGANGNERLIYLEHAALRQRLNEVLGIGQWSPIVRSRWAEDVESAGRKSVRVYVEVVLLIRGAFAGEAIGAMTYFPNNAAQNYSDAVEGAKSEAIRRCAKELGVGLQAWRKDFCEGWFARREPKRERAARAAAPIQDKSGYRDTDGELSVTGEGIPPEPNAQFEGDWRDTICHFGKNKGIRLGDMEPQQLKWYCLEWEARPFRGRISEEDTALRAALDKARDEKGFKRDSKSGNQKPVAPSEEEDSEIPFS